MNSIIIGTNKFLHIHLIRLVYIVTSQVNRTTQNKYADVRIPSVSLLALIRYQTNNEMS